MHFLGIVALSTCIPVVVLFGIFAVYIARKKQSLNILEFITARNSVSLTKIAWSFYAASIGSSVIFAPVAFSVDEINGAGILGLLSFSIFTGVPIIMIAYFGKWIRIKFPNVNSLGHFAKERFGVHVQWMVTLLVFFNISIAMAAEFTGIGELFSKILDLDPLIPILTVGLITLIYTCVGGLYVSIITDQYQAIFSLFLLLIMTIYISVTFRPDSLPVLPAHLGINRAGIESIFTLFLALGSSCFYSDAMWQRVYASEDEKSLKLGAILGALLTIFVVFSFGFAGFMATWAGYSQDSNTAFFSILKAGQTEPPVWILIIVSLFAITMVRIQNFYILERICD
jgi:Na+/proline symporter